MDIGVSANWLRFFGRCRWFCALALFTAATGFLADKPEAIVACLQILAYR